MIPERLGVAARDVEQAWREGWKDIDRVLSELRAALRDYDRASREEEAAAFREQYGTCPHRRVVGPSNIFSDDPVERHGGELTCGAPPVAVHATLRKRQKAGTMRGPEVEGVELETVECAAGHFYVVGRDGEAVPVSGVMDDVVIQEGLL